MAKRRGYDDEYYVKKLLEKNYGPYSVLKVAVSQKAPDYIVFANGRVIGVEVKGRHLPKFRPTKHDKDQWVMIGEWMNCLHLPVEYYVITRFKNGKSTKLHVDNISHYMFGEKYIKS